MDLDKRVEPTRAKLGPSSPPERFALELATGARFTAGSVGGGPVPGIGDMNRGILPEPYWAAAHEAVYAVYHYETPILWQAKDGQWQVPGHRYSVTTSKIRETMVRALALNGVKAERI